MARRGRQQRPGRRLLFALAFVLVGVVAGAVVVELEDPGPPPVVPDPLPVLATPVLSARRLPAALAAPAADRRLAELLDPILDRQEGATVCLTVAAGGRRIYERAADAVVVPASVEKLLTATAALQVLGPDFTFATTIVAAAAPGPDGVVAGDAWLVGGGDPVLSTAAYTARFRNQPQIHTPVEGLATALAAAGVTAITGNLLGDETRYDLDRYPDVWPDRYISQDQSGPLSALSVDDGWATFPPNFETPTPDETPAPEPAAHAAAVVAEVAAGYGVAIAGTGAGQAPPGAVELARIESPPLHELVAELLRESDNQTGELLLKEIALALGRPPTTVGGAAAVSNVAVELGLPFAVVVDGSGLATGNRVSCDLVQTLLDHAGPDSPIGLGLATAGVDGTLSRRFLESTVQGRLRAKTGTLNAVTALAGFLPTTPGASASFAFVVNALPADDVDDATTALVDEDDLELQEELVEAIDTYPAGPPLAELGPRPVLAPP